MSNVDEAPEGVEDFREFLRNQGQRIAAEGREAGFFSHRGTTGAAREAVLRKPLEEFLPARYGVSSGEVRASDGSVSSQWDILIYDKLDTPRMYSGAATVLPIEGILAAISVKSKVDKAAIKDATKAARLLRAMPRTGREIPGLSPAVFLFGFQGIAVKTIIDHILGAIESEANVGEANAEDDDDLNRSLLTGVCILDRGLIFAKGAEGEINTQDIRSYFYADASDGAWGIFVSLLWLALHRAEKRTPNIWSYIVPGELLDPE